MLGGPWEMEVNARYARQRVEEEAARFRRAASATTGSARRPGPLSALAVAIGSALIAVGERLAGSPRPGRSAAGRAA